ncbi:MAG: cupin domain-containing protein [Herbaspirillum sp.]|nr:cupin domain-containing protein [Herbaspirillum sp.]
MSNRIPTTSKEREVKLTSDAEYFEYTSSANPIAAKIITKVPYRTFDSSLYAAGETRAITLDISTDLETPYPATAPGLCAHFARVNAGEGLDFDANATSLIFYVISGKGGASQQGKELSFGQGDFLTFPGGAGVSIKAETTTCLYHVNDTPLLSYLGVSVTEQRFQPTLYPAQRAKEELAQVALMPFAAKRNRISILLGNKNFPQTRTVTHTLWAMFGIVPAGAVQKPHRHQSVALDFVADCSPGTYSLVGTAVDENGNIQNPQRVDWSPGMAFITPPGYWHAHYNESDKPAYIIPIQDAGLHTYLRSLDIRFAL